MMGMKLRLFKMSPFCPVSFGPALHITISIEINTTGRYIYQQMPIILIFVKLVKKWQK